MTMTSVSTRPSDARSTTPAEGETVALSGQDGSTLVDGQKIPMFIDVLAQVLPASVLSPLISGAVPANTGADAESVPVAGLPSMLNPSGEKSAKADSNHETETIDQTTESLPAFAESSVLYFMAQPVNAVPTPMPMVGGMSRGGTPTVATSTEAQALAVDALVASGTGSEFVGRGQDALTLRAQLGGAALQTAPSVALPDGTEAGDVVSGDTGTVTTAAIDGARLLQGGSAPSLDSVQAAPLALRSPQPDLWQRPLVQALGERLQIQGSKGEEQAVIRLDPPSLGRVEIVLRQEGAGWQVQLSATHPEVTRQLHAITDTLRQELSVRQQAAVTVQVSSDHLGDAQGRNPQRQQQDAQEHNAPGRAWNAEGTDEKEQTFDLA